MVYFQRFFPIPVTVLVENSTRLALRTDLNVQNALDDKEYQPITGVTGCGHQDVGVRK